MVETFKLGADAPPPEVKAVRLTARIDRRELGSFVLREGTAFVGSAPENDLVLAEESVSRNHVELLLQPGSVLVRDRGSTNGTRYQGARISSAQVPFGAALKLGRVELRVEPESDATSARLGRLTTSAPSMMRVIEFLSRAAPYDVTVLLEGETGSGKEVVARAIHESSPRTTRSFEV